MYGEIFFDESQNSQQTYQSVLNPCKDGYVNSDVHDKKNGYEKCMNSVQIGHAKNIEKNRQSDGLAFKLIVYNLMKSIV